MRKNTIRITALVIALSGILLVVAAPKKGMSKNNSCKESMNECCRKKRNGGTDNMIMETLSGQFFTSSGM